MRLYLFAYSSADFRLSPRFILVSLIVFPDRYAVLDILEVLDFMDASHIHKKRRLRYCSSTHKGLRTYPTSQINNNETYADMTNRLPRNGRFGTKVIPVGVIAYFAFDLFIKKCSKLFVRQIQSVNKRHSICNESPLTLLLLAGRRR